ncbi:hypothetical protein [Ornithinimicrobium kibberense]
MARSRTRPAGSGASCRRGVGCCGGSNWWPPARVRAGGSPPAACRGTGPR